MRPYDRTVTVDTQFKPPSFSASNGKCYTVTSLSLKLTGITNLGKELELPPSCFHSTLSGATFLGGEGNLIVLTW